MNASSHYTPTNVSGTFDVKDVQVKYLHFDKFVESSTFKDLVVFQSVSRKTKSNGLPTTVLLLLLPQLFRFQLYKSALKINIHHSFFWNRFPAFRLASFPSQV